MANKEKLVANAQKFISKGQISKAISEYQTLVKAFPKDVRNRQKLAELLSRDKCNDEALEEYEAVAKHYTDTGFYLKSIAVYKQMQKIDPSRADIYHHLAELNEKQGLIGNALTEYRNLVAFYDKNKMHQEAIGVLERMLELDPENLNVAAKLAECYMATGRKEDAFEKFRVILEPLVAKGEHTKIIKLYERFLEICPEDGPARLPLVRALLESGSADKAIQILKNLLKHAPEDHEINRCLADAYVAIEDFANARLTLKHLLKQQEGDLALRAYYVRICLDAGEVERARDRLEEWKDAFFAAKLLSELKNLYERLNGLLAGDAMVAATLTAIYEVLGDTANLDRKSTPAAGSAETVETADDAVLDEAIDDVETLDMIGDAVSPDGEESAIAAREHDAHRPEETISTVGLELELDLDFDAPSSQAEVADENDEPAVSAEEPLPQDEMVDAAGEEEDVDVEIELELDDWGNFDLEFEGHIIAAEPAATTEETSPETVEDFAAEGFVLAEDLEPTAEISDGIPTPGELEDVYAEDASLSAKFEPDDSEHIAQHDDESVLETRLEVQEDIQEDSPVDSFMSAEDVEHGEEHEALSDVAELDSVAVAPGNEPSSEAEADELLDDVEALEELETLDDLEELDDLEDVEEPEALEEVEELEDVEELDVLVEVAAPSRAALDFAAALNVDAELEEAQFYLQQGLYDDAEKVIQTLMEYRPGLPELQAKMAEISQGRQMSESDTESQSTVFVDLMADLHDDDLLAAADLLDSFGSSLEADDNLSQKLVSELDSSDTESHYNLGIAYKEMGLYEDAITEFEKAAKDPARSIDCISLTGQCHLESGDTAAALAAFKSGLAHKDLTDEGRMTLNFELGMLHQLNGELLEALERFQLVAEKDSFFREVADHVKSLRKDLGLDDSDDDGGPQGNRDRVSYV